MRPAPSTRRDHGISCSRHCPLLLFDGLEPLPLALAHEIGSSSLFSQASSPIHVLRRERAICSIAAQRSDKVQTQPCAAPTTRGPMPGRPTPGPQAHRLPDRYHIGVKESCPAPSLTLL